MAKIVIILFSLLSVILPAPAIANGIDKNNSELAEVAITLLAAEGALILNSTWASNSPHSYGATMALLAPIALENVFTKNTVGGWSLLIAVESLAIYNIKIDQNQKQKYFRTTWLPHTLSLF